MLAVYTYLNTAALCCLLSNIKSMREQLDRLGLCFNWDRVSRQWRRTFRSGYLTLLTWLLLFLTGSYHLSSRLLQVDTVSVCEALSSRTGVSERGRNGLCAKVHILVLFERNNMIGLGVRSLTVREMIEAACLLLSEENDRIEKRRRWLKPFWLCLMKWDDLEISLWTVY